MSVLDSIGAATIERLRRLHYLSAVMACALYYGFHPKTWRRSVRSVFIRQLLFTGAEATEFTSRIAVLVGVSAVVQAQVWLGKVGQSQYLGPILVAVIVRELGPLLA